MSEENHEEEREENRAFLAVRLSVGAVLYLAALGIKLTAVPVPHLAFLLFGLSAVLAGYDVVFHAITDLFHGKIGEELLMSVSSVAAISIGEAAEAGAVMLLYQLGELIGDATADRTREAVGKLSDIRPDEAWMLSEGDFHRVDPRTVPVGSLLRIRTGERIPLDGEVVAGEGSADECAMTGESVPHALFPGEKAVSGTVLVSGTVQVRTTADFEKSSVSEVLSLMESGLSGRARSERAIEKFAAVYTPAILGLALLCAVIPPIFFGGWSEWIRRGCMILVVGCPCSLVISVPLAWFAGVGRVAKTGLLMRGGGTLESLGKVKTAAFDKTGTLTDGRFTVEGVIPAEGVEKEELLAAAAFCESGSRHPIGLAVVEAAGKSAVLPERFEEIPGFGVSCSDGAHAYLCGNRRLLDRAGVNVPEKENGTSVFVARDGRYLGEITESDHVTESARPAISALHGLGVTPISVLTGDREKSAEEVLTAVGADGFHARLLPADKVRLAESQRATEGPLLYVGDGLNDAPVLSLADCGIAMGGAGTETAKRVADGILMTDSLTAIPEAIRLSRFTALIAAENVAVSLSVKAVFLALGLFGLVPMAAAVFADVGLLLLCVGNAVRIVKKK